MALHSLLLNGSALLLVPGEERPHPEFLRACAEQSSGVWSWCPDDPALHMLQKLGILGNKRGYRGINY